MDKLWISDIHNRYLKYIKNNIEKFKNNEYYIDDLSSLSLKYYTLAISSYLMNNNSNELKKYMYISSTLKKEIIMRYGIDESISNSSVKMNNMYQIIQGIISDNWDLVINFSQIIGGRKKEEKDDSPFTYNYGYILKYIILDEYEKAELYINKLKELKNKQKYKLYTGYINVLIGIYNKNEIEIIQGLEEMIYQHKRKQNNKDTLEEYICIDAIGLAKLALKKGLDIRFEHELAPKELIDFHEIEYPEIEVLKYI